MTNLPERGAWSGIGDITVTAGGDINGVTVVKELFGVIFLGFLTIFLLIALQRAHARNRELLIQLAERQQP